MPGKWMLERRVSQRLTITVGLTVALAVLWAVPALGISFDDPNVFGAGEGWAPPSVLGPGSSYYGVTKLQERLTELGFRPGPIDGYYGAPLEAAVVAFQKEHDLERDGLFRSSYWDLLDESIILAASTDPDRVEVDLGRQVLYLVVDNRVATVVPISSGSGGTYRGLSGGASRARTPEGAFRFYRHVQGWRISYLGGLYEPYYFDGGYAIHGSLSVPPYPASHGCVRVQMEDMNYLKNQLAVGMPVYVYGGRKSRDQVVPTLADGMTLTGAMAPPATSS
jgi:peptidoglycan hydrolase-like protein with peptidoglycan-binding domain